MYFLLSSNLSTGIVIRYSPFWVRLSQWAPSKPARFNPLRQQPFPTIPVRSRQATNTTTYHHHVQGIVRLRGLGNEKLKSFVGHVTPKKTIQKRCTCKNSSINEKVIVLECLGFFDTENPAQRQIMFCTCLFVGRYHGNDPQTDKLKHSVHPIFQILNSWQNRSGFLNVVPCVMTNALQ